MITKNKAVIAAGLKFAQARLSPGMVEQIAGEAAVDTPDSYFEAVNTEYTHRRDILVSALNKMDGVYCPNPGGAFYAIARLPIDDSDKFCQWLLEEFNYKKQTVMLAPATGFYGSADLGKDLKEAIIDYLFRIFHAFRITHTHFKEHAVVGLVKALLHRSFAVDTSGY